MHHKMSNNYTTQDVLTYYTTTYSTYLITVLHSITPHQYAITHKIPTRYSAFIIKHAHLSTYANKLYKQNPVRFNQYKQTYIILFCGSY